MNKKKLIRSGVALALSISMASGITLSTPAVAEANTGNIIGAIVGGIAASAEMNKEIKYYNTTEEGRQALNNQLREKYGVNDDYALNNQLDRIFTNLTTAIGSQDATIYDRPYLYFINNEDSFNAFCTLGHNMSVNTGLYNYLNNEDEIAVVLAHEMGHGQKDHPAKGMKRSLGPAILASATGTDRDSPSRWSGRQITSPLNTSRALRTTREQRQRYGSASSTWTATTPPMSSPSCPVPPIIRQMPRAVTTTPRS